MTAPLARVILHLGILIRAEKRRPSLFIFIPCIFYRLELIILLIYKKNSGIFARSDAKIPMATREEL